MGLGVAPASPRLPSVFAVLADWLSGAGLLSRFALGAAAGACAALAMAPFHLIPLLFLGFTVLVWLIDGLGTLERRLLSAAWIGWSFGLGFFAVSLFWIGNAFLVDAKTYAAMMPVAMVALNAGLALFPALAVVLARLFWTSGAARVLALAAAWTGVEWLRGHVLSGFPWNLAGHAWGDTLPMLQIAALVGIYGISLLTVLVAAAPALLADFSGGRAAPAHLGALAWIAGALLLAGATLGFGLMRLAAPPGPSVPNVRLRIIQPSIPQARKLTSDEAAAIFKTHIELMTRPGYDKVTHVIWTEAAVPVMLGAEPNALASLAATLGPKRWLIAGSARAEPVVPAASNAAQPASRPSERYFNSLFLISPLGTIAAAYDKHHLVPFGEYLPLQRLLSGLGFKQLIDREVGFTPGPGVKTIDVPGAPPFGALVCYEAIFPGAVVEPHRRPGWLVNVTDDTWFGHGFGPRQHFEIARVRAIEEGLPLVRAANNGISAVIDTRGRVLGELGFDVVNSLDADLPSAEQPTLYARIGDLAFLAIWMLSVLLTLVLARSSKTPA